MMIKLRVAIIAIALVAAVPVPSSAQSCFWSHFDHEVTYDASGIWNPNAYRGTMYALTAAGIAGAVWEGAESRFGKTMWQGIDSEIFSGVAAYAGKYIFTRVRPAQENNPCLWFKGKGNYSFPSGEASVAAGLVTPYVLEYGSEYPATYALLLLPLWVGAGRVKNQAHWQSDVVVGWAVGGLSGWYAHTRDLPLMIEILPHGVAVGLHTQF